MRLPAMLRWAAVALALAAAALLAAPAAAFYLPGVAPNDFQKVPAPFLLPSLVTVLSVPSRRISTARSSVPRLLAARYCRVGGRGVRDLGILLAVLLLCGIE
jgi:hypothetical protein